MTWFEAAGLVALGFAVGTYGTMVGVGGGFFMVPVLLFLNNPSRVAAGTSLAVVFANAVSGTVSYLRRRRVDVRSGLLFSIAGAPGAVLGAAIDQVLPHRVFTLLFAALLVVVAVRLFFGSPRSSDAGAATAPGVAANDSAQTPRYNVAVALPIAVGAGFLAGMFGIGGGIVQVPSMVYLLGFSAHAAAATSQFTIALTSLFGAASHVYYGDVLVAPALLLSAGAIPGAQLGAALSGRMHADRLLRWLSLAAVFGSLYLIFGRG